MLQMNWTMIQMYNVTTLKGVGKKRTNLSALGKQGFLTYYHQISL